MASGKAIGATLVLGGGGATAGAAMGGAFSSSKEQTQDKEKDSTQQQTTVTTEPTPELFTSTLDSTYSSSILSKMKETNLPFLVKPISTTKPEDTKKWWVWHYDSKFKDHKPTADADSPFNKVTQAYNDKADENKSLNQACDTAYKTVASTGYVFNNNLFTNIKKFCSKAPETTDLSEPKSTPATVKAEAPYELGVLSVATTAPKLIKTEGTDNDLWFKWAFEKRVKGKNANASSTFSTTSVTKGVKEENDNTDTSLKHACDEAYKKNRHELTDVTNGKNTVLKDIGQYCALIQEKLTAPNTVSKNEPGTGIVTFQTNDVFSETQNTDYKDKILSLMRKDNLTKIVKHNQDQNRTWWDWAFKKKYQEKIKEAGVKDKLDDIFKGLESSYSKDASASKQTSLNQACHKAYSEVGGKYKFGDTDYLLDNIGQFCTKGEQAQDVSEPLKPEVITDVEDTNYKEKIFKGETGKKNKDLLVKATGTNNQLWWEWVYHKKYLKTESTSTHFTKESKVKKSYAATSDNNENNNLALNNVCNAAYQLEPSALKTNGGTIKIITDVGKFCKHGETELSEPAN